MYTCMVTGQPYDDGLAFPYDTAAPDAPTVGRKPPLSPEQITAGRQMLEDPPLSAGAVARAFRVSPQTIARHVLGQPRS